MPKKTNEETEAHKKEEIRNAMLTEVRNSYKSSDALVSTIDSQLSKMDSNTNRNLIAAFAQLRAQYDYSRADVIEAVSGLLDSTDGSNPSNPLNSDIGLKFHTQNAAKYLGDFQNLHQQVQVAYTSQHPPSLEQREPIMAGHNPERKHKHKHQRAELFDVLKGEYGENFQKDLNSSQAASILKGQKMGSYIIHKSSKENHLTVTQVKNEQGELSRHQYPYLKDNNKPDTSSVKKLCAKVAECEATLKENTPNETIRHEGSRRKP